MRRRGEGSGARGRASVPPPAPVARSAASSLLVARPYTCLAPPPPPHPSPPRAHRLHSAVLCPACARPCRTASPALFRRAPLAPSLALPSSSLAVPYPLPRARLRSPLPSPYPPAPPSRRPHRGKHTVSALGRLTDLSTAVRASRRRGEPLSCDALVTGCRSCALRRVALSVSATRAAIHNRAHVFPSPYRDRDREREREREIDR